MQEKVDGSILKLWWNEAHGIWWVSTNGAYNAANAEVMFPTKDVRNFLELYLHAIYKDGKAILDYTSLIKGFTYIFEIVSPHNRIVVPYPEIDIYHIGTRENSSGIEYDVDLGVKKPRLYDFSDKDAILKYAEEMPYTEEGFVVVDKYWNRVKIKSADYIRVHRLRGEAVPTRGKILDIIRNDGQDDFLSYFPEYKDQFAEITEKWSDTVAKVVLDVVDYAIKGWDKETDRKKYAIEFAKNCRVPDYMFQLKDGKRTTNAESVIEYFREMNIDKLLKILGL